MTNVLLGPSPLLPQLIPIYKQLLAALKEAGAESVQIDEPILVLDSASLYEKQFAQAYAELAPVSPKLVLTTYYGRLDSNVTFVAKLPVAALHIDLDRAPAQLDEVIAAVKPTNLVLSLGVVSGRNIWKTDFQAALKLGQKAVDALGKDRVIIASSSSLLHTPVSLAAETKLTAEQKDWFALPSRRRPERASALAIRTDSVSRRGQALEITRSKDGASAADISMATAARVGPMSVKIGLSEADELNVLSMFGSCTCCRTRRLGSKGFGPRARRADHTPKSTRTGANGHHSWSTRSS
ncbi:hypothetical protein NUW54_g2025 [Trametes sanguinea]|uniref:Uncharacterized protein n=1 Tax=Trametes sanguinea TaxID=158606 RepID=A0ACC1Q6H7_9APHY|nr:hypothetical protein NUW54_g2025 [Trametes sanguinea]